MSEDFQIQTIDAPDVIAVEKSFEAGAFSVPKNLATSYASIKEIMSDEGLAQQGTPYAKYLDMKWDEVRNKSMFMLMVSTMFQKHKVVAGIPVRANGNETSSAQACFGEKKYLKFSHFGPVTNSLASYKKAAIWAHQNNVKLGTFSVESYVGVQRGEDPKAAETEIFIPLARS